ncbi:MAG: type IV secretion protein DotG [Micavibrio aeruginosavorus]|uniref:Type IV secretion protein DotG n=1 Tax=Micavibrio aeruginosavorus TaxID=349221 RepID=A0A2W5N6P6_9BACT|nr:MAG: type IV secretion protein DotG [Micavibrio aeruginosavorus]
MSNDDLDNDLDVENFDDGEGFDDFSKKGSLGDMWRNNPMVKIGVILAAFAIIVGAIILFGGSAEKKQRSSVAGASDITEAPGSSEVSATMKEAIDTKNLENAENALRTSGSAVPIPVEPPKGVIPVPVEEMSGEDPLERWRRMQEERVRQQEMLAQAKPQTAPVAPPVDTKTPAVNAMSQAMVTQMQSILQNQKIPEPRFKKITGVTFVEDSERKKMEKLAAAQREMQQMQAAAMVDEQVENIIIPAGTIEYGQLLIEANTDAPGPVLAQIVSGPLKGSRVLGSFKSTDQYLTLEFSQLVLDGISYPIQAIAIDPDTTMPGMITEIDHRYFKRVILPAAAAFVSGFADAVSESGTTSVYISDSSVTQSTSDKDSKQEVASGISEAGDELSDIMDEEADRTQPMLRVAAGTPMGVLFTQPVTDTNLASTR